MDERNLPWLHLLVAGLCEVVWAVALGYAGGLERPEFYIVVAVFLAMSIYLLSRAVGEGLPTGTAYAVWVGIGAVGTMTASIALGNEPVTSLKLVFVGIVVVGILGLQVCSGPKAQD